MPENGLGWELKIDREGKVSLLMVEKFQMEGFLNWNSGTGGNAKLQLGHVYVTEGGSRVADHVLISSWSM
jgi:hypothetical protein